jgi:hypothetical protein
MTLLHAVGSQSIKVTPFLYSLVFIIPLDLHALCGYWDFSVLISPKLIPAE